MARKGVKMVTPTGPNPVIIEKLEKLAKTLPAESDKMTRILRMKKGELSFEATKQNRFSRAAKWVQKKIKSDSFRLTSDTSLKRSLKEIHDELSKHTEKDFLQGLPDDQQQNILKTIKAVNKIITLEHESKMAKGKAKELPTLSELKLHFKRQETASEPQPKLGYRKPK